MGGRGDLLIVIAIVISFLYIKQANYVVLLWYIPLRSNKRWYAEGTENDETITCGSDEEEGPPLIYINACYKPNSWLGSGEIGRKGRGPRS